MQNEITPLSILVTDDMPQNRTYIIQIINSKLTNAQINEAEDGKAAVALTADRIATTGRSFDLIIMDFKMPQLNGEEASLQIRALEQAANIAKPSLIITWSSVLSVPFQGADDSLPKMLTKVEFEAFLRRYQLN